MKLVQPIRDLDTMQKCFEIAREHDAHRKTGEVCWELILLVGLNTSLRVSDFRRFKVSDLRGRDYAQMQAKKAGKEARILINPQARKEINRLLAGGSRTSISSRAARRTALPTRPGRSPGSGAIRS